MNFSDIYKKYINIFMNNYVYIQIIATYVEKVAIIIFWFPQSEI